MREAMALLRPHYPDEVSPTEPAWRAFETQLQRSGRVDLPMAEAMRRTADVQTGALKKYVRGTQRFLLVVVALVLLSLVLGLVKSQELLRQLRVARVEQQESEERFAQLSAASFEGISISQNGALITANDQFCALFGYSHGELGGMNAALLVPPKVREFVLQKMVANDEIP